MAANGWHRCFNEVASKEANAPLDVELATGKVFASTKSPPKRRMRLFQQVARQHRPLASTKSPPKRRMRQHPIKSLSHL